LFEVDRDGPIASSSIAALSLDSGDQKVLLTGGSYPQYSPTGHLVYAGAGSLWAVTFNIDRLETTGDPVPVLENVLTKESGAANYDFSNDGTLVYLPGDVVTNRQLVWVDRQGREEPLGAEQLTYIHVALSPDGTHVATTVAEAANTDIWIYDIERGTSTRFTFDPAEDRYPIWTTNGRRIVFRSDRGQGALLWRLADGTGPAETLLSMAEYIFPYAFSPDGSLLAFTQIDPETDADIHLLSFQDEATSRPLIQEPFGQTAPSISPDGRWLAYQSRESGRQEVYVRPFPNVDEGKWQISTTGGRFPLWGPDGRELFYRGEGAMMVVPVDTEPAFTPGQPATLFPDRYWRESGPTYSLSPDGKRLLMIKEAFRSGAASPQIYVVLSWFEELNRLVPRDN
jgi:serine/threonine-protein kinase